MTSDFARIDWEVLQKISSRIVNEVDHVNRVFPLYSAWWLRSDVIDYAVNVIYFIYDTA
jgi:hypothetical protein